MILRVVGCRSYRLTAAVMGCGQSKINLYPRRNKNGGKANGAKKTGAADKDADEEEGAAGSAGADGDVTEDDCEKGKHVLPLASHTVVIEVSASQQDFFKMLDEKIEKGRDYDSSSETEIRLERERRMTLIREWQSSSQSSQQSQPSPPTPVRRRPPPPRPERQGSPASAVRRHQQPSQLASPPPRRCHSAQGQHQHEISEKKTQANGRDWQDPIHSPVRRPHSAGSNWKGAPKVAPYCQKSTKVDANDSQKEIPLEGTFSSHDSSQITYNPTFQTHSPAHAPLKTNPALPQQPYIAQIVTYPTVNQALPNSYISPPETYHDQTAIDNSKFPIVPKQPIIAAVNPQPNIYYIHGNINQQPSPDQLLTQKQQTALHLQHYVAMKQAQQNMFGYIQRMPHTVYPNPEIPHQANDCRTYDTTEESYGVAYYAGYRGPPRPRSAPTPNNNIVRPMPISPGVNPSMAPIVNQVSMFTHVTPIMPTYGQYPLGQLPQTEVQYYHQAQVMQNMYRPGSAGSAGTLTRYQSKEKYSVGVSGDAGIKSNECQSFNIVRQKSVGQIVSLGGQDLGVYQNANDQPESGGRSPDEFPLPQVAEDPARSGVNYIQKGQVDSATQFSSANAIEKTKKINGGTLKSRTQSLKNSKSVDSKKD